MLDVRNYIIVFFGSGVSILRWHNNLDVVNDTHIVKVTEEEHLVSLDDLHWYLCS